MIPIVARVRWTSVVVLVIAFSGPSVAVIIREGGEMDTCDIRDLIVERPTGAFPSGYQFSVAQAGTVGSDGVHRP